MLNFVLSTTSFPNCKGEGFHFRNGPESVIQRVLAFDLPVRPLPLILTICHQPLLSRKEGRLLIRVSCVRVVYSPRLSFTRCLRSTGGVISLEAAFGGENLTSRCTGGANSGPCSLRTARRWRGQVQHTGCWLPSRPFIRAAGDTNQGPHLRHRLPPGILPRGNLTR